MMGLMGYINLDYINEREDMFPGYCRFTHDEGEERTVWGEEGEKVDKVV